MKVKMSEIEHELNEVMFCIVRRSFRKLENMRLEAPEILMNQTNDTLKQISKKFFNVFMKYVEEEKNNSIEAYKHSIPCFFCKHRQEEDNLENEYEQVTTCDKKHDPLVFINGSYEVRSTGCIDFEEGGMSLPVSYIKESIEHTKNLYT